MGWGGVGGCLYSLQLPSDQSPQVSDENHTVVQSNPPVTPSIELDELRHETVNKNYRVISLKIKQELQSYSS